LPTHFAYTTLFRSTESALFAMLEHYPLSGFVSLIAILLFSTFFITSADSATFVLGMQTTGGSLYPDNRVKLVWGIVQSSAAAVLLLQGGLEALQTASIIAAFPFTIILILVIISLLKALRLESEELQRRKKKRTQSKRI